MQNRKRAAEKKRRMAIAEMHSNSVTITSFNKSLVNATSDGRPHAHLLRINANTRIRKQRMSPAYCDPSYQSANRRMLMK